jgi:transposase
MFTQKLLPNPRLLHSLGAVVAPDAITFCAVSVSPVAACPVCGTLSSRAHSSYLRSLADLPCLGTPVRLNLHTRRFFCDAPHCPRAIFTERLPEVAASYARRTLRQTHRLQEIAHAQGGEAGARMTHCLAMSASPDTLLRHLARRPAAPPEAPRVLGVDDWALRKGHRYGTILVDLEHSEVVDLLPDRTAETLATWLKEHPGVEIIARDRADAYKEGALAGAPDAQQVADRWHLLKNLVEALEAAVAREERALQQAATREEPCTDPAAATTTGPAMPDEGPVSPPPPTSRAGRARAERRERKQAIFAEVRRLYEAGYTLAEIARKTGKNRRTVRKYVNTDGFPEPKRRQRRGGLVGFEAYLQRRFREGCHNAAQLWREIREAGYRGSRSAVRQWVSAWRAELPSGERPGKSQRSAARAPAPRAVVWWLLRSPEGLTEEQATFLEHLKQKAPPIEVAQSLGREFFTLTREREGEKLEGWMERAIESGIEELKRFCRSVRQDWEAVVAGLTLEWSTGPVEGAINRLKALKRAMYGRAGLPLLRARLLPLAAVA